MGRGRRRKSVAAQGFGTRPRAARLDHPVDGDGLLSGCRCQLRMSAA